MTPIGEEFPVNTNSLDSQQSPRIDANAAGDFVVVWDELITLTGSGIPLVTSGAPTTGHGVAARRFFSDGTPVGDPFRIAGDIATQLIEPAVASNATSDFVVVWIQLPDRGIFARGFSDGEGSFGPFQVSDIPSSNSTAEIGADAAGNYVVVWQGVPSPTPDVPVVIGKRFPAGGTEGTQFIVSASAGEALDNHAVAMDRDGNIVVVWSSFESQVTGDIVEVQRFNAQLVPQGSPIRANETPASASDTIGVDTSVDGQFVVAWESLDGRSIRARRFNSEGNPITDEIPVNMLMGDGVVNPSVTSAANGDFAVVWTLTLSEGAPSVRARRFSGSGEPQTDEFTVNTSRQQELPLPAAASADNGDFVVVWQNFFSSDGFNYFIFGQRYAVIGAQ